MIEQLNKMIYTLTNSVLHAGLHSSVVLGFDWEKESSDLEWNGVDLGQERNLNDRQEGGYEEIVSDNVDEKSK